MIFAAIAVVSLGALLYGESQEDQTHRWIFKPITSALFLLTALSGGLDDAYSKTLFVGLVFCFFGDVFLIPEGKNWFLAGLGAFLAGHITYIIAFNGLVPFYELNPLLLILIGGLSGVIFLWLRPRLGDMQIPVMLYVIVITMMVWSACAVYFEGDQKESLRRLVGIGAVSFYFSDLAVAIDRFVKPGFVNRAWGLPLYYLGQFLLALSVG